MNLENNSPELDPKKRNRTELTYEQLIKQLQPELEKHPEGQKIPPIPLDAEILGVVTEYVESIGLTVASSCPSKIAIGGIFFDHSGLKEGRVGMYNNLRTVSFLYFWADKTLRTIVITPRDGIDARLLGMAIMWGLLANVPDSIVAAKPGTTADFFAINSYDLSTLIDIPAIELFKKGYRQECDKELQQAELNLRRCKQETETLRINLEKLADKIQGHPLELEKAHDRTFWWQLTAMIAITLIPVTAAICHYLRF